MEIIINYDKLLIKSNKLHNYSLIFCNLILKILIINIKICFNIIKLQFLNLFKKNKYI